MRSPFIVLTTFMLIAASALAGCATTLEPKGPDPAAREARLLGKFLSGRYADREADPASAASAYAAGLADDPGNVVLLDGALTAALTAGQTMEAIALAQAARAEARELPLVLLTQAAQALAARDPKRASVLAEQVSGSPMDDVAGRMLSAWGLAAAGQREAALAALAKADPRLRSAGLGGLLDDQTALLLLHLKDPAGAARSFPEAGDVPLRLSSVTVRLAQAQLANGQRDRALASLNGRANQVTDPRLQRAAQRISAGNDPDSELTAQEGAALGIASFAIALSGQIGAQTYLPYLTLARIVDPANEEITLIAAEAHRELGDRAAAFMALKGIAADSLYAPGADIQRALLLQDAGDTAAAISAGERAALSGQRSALAALAELYRQAEQWDKAKAVYDQLIEGAPAPDWSLYFLRGAALERLQLWPEAERDLRKALDLSPDQPEVLNYLGYTWVERGINLKEALALLERAVEQAPEAGHIVDSLGWAKFRLKRNQEALDLLERAALILPGDVTVNDHLGDVYWSVGRKREAGFQWQHALRLAKPEDAEPLRRKLKEKGFSEGPSLASTANP